MSATPAQFDAEPSHIELNSIPEHQVLVTIKSGEIVRAQTVLSLDNARGLYANLGFAIDDIQNANAAALAQSDAHADFLSQMQATEFLGEPDDNFERHLHARVSKLEHEVVALAQSDAEPVARQIERMRIALGRISSICRDSVADMPPPRPDASAGLIEAADIVKDWSQACVKDSEANILDALAKQLRVRAADRSGK